MERLYSFDTITSSGKKRFFDSYSTKARAVEALKEWLKENYGGKAVLLRDSKEQPEIGINRDYIETWISEAVYESIFTGKRRVCPIRKLDVDQT